MNLLFFMHFTNSFTGGYKYNKEFADYLSSYAAKEIKKLPNDMLWYRGWRKMLLPFGILKWLRLITDDTLVFFGDTGYIRNLPVVICARLFKKNKSTVIVHHFQLYEKMSINGFVHSSLMKLYIYCIKSIIVPSPYTYDVAKSLFPRKQIYYIPIPFSNKYVPSQDYETGNFLYVGTIEERKGLIFLIEALGIIKKQRPEVMFCLSIVGKIVQQEYFDRLQSMIKQVGIDKNVHFLGRVSNEELESCYRKAEIFTHPSLLEGYGIVLVEAMQHGLPIIAFNNTAMPYSIVDNVNGMLVENKNAEAFAKKILQLTGNKKMHNQYREGICETMMLIKNRSDFEGTIREFYNANNY